GESARGKPVRLPAWWLEALRRLCGERSTTQITDELNAIVRRQPPFRREAVGDFLAGKVTTDVMMDAFLMMFPELPPPMFFASSYEEAHQLLQVAKRYDKQAVEAVSGSTRRAGKKLEDLENLRLTETITNIDEDEAGTASGTRARKGRSSR